MGVRRKQHGVGYTCKLLNHRMRHKPLPPLEQVESLLEICENSPSGLKWKVKRKNRNPGDVAGTCRPSGHWQVKINNTHYGVHRIIFLLQNKYDPKDSVVDHCFGTEKPLELRAASRAENRWNSKKQKMVKVSTKEFTGIKEISTGAPP